MSRERTLGLALLLAALLLIPALVFLPVNAWLLAIVEWARGAGALGVLVFILLYVAAAVLFIPGSLLTLGAGFLYGPLLGFGVVSVASTLGATLAFLLGRTVARGWISDKLQGRRGFAAVDRAVERAGFKMVLLLRLSPIFPFIVLNYALGLTRVRAGHYVLGSWLGMMPGTLLYVYLGSLITSAAELTSGERPEAGALGYGVLALGLVATLAFVVVITRIARRALDQELQRTKEVAT